MSETATYLPRLRRGTALFVSVLALGASSCNSFEQAHDPAESVKKVQQSLAALAIKGKAPKTGYSRDEFRHWISVKGCDVRERILQRDLVDKTLDKKDCKVLAGTLHDPYTGKQIRYVRDQDTNNDGKKDSNDDVQIDHAVALANAWQTGAQGTAAGDRADRIRLANDPLNLVAVDGPANNQKGDADAATWLPPNKAYRCTYVARQVLVKERYELWMTEPEHQAIADILAGCDDIPLDDILAPLPGV